MEIDIRSFYPINIIDSCSVWNVLSSTLLLAATIQSKCYFSITKFVEYECLFKPRKDLIRSEEELKNKLSQLLEKKIINCFSLSIADLQEVELLNKRKKLGLGELSSIAFAKRTNQCFLTDDQKARKLAKEFLGNSMVQTTPHLLGWLLLNQSLSESELDSIIIEHNNNGRPLEQYFREVHLEYLRIRLFVT